jgi:hypothetical protein
MHLVAKFYVIVIFALVYIAPLVMNYMQVGVVFSGNHYVENHAYIRDATELKQHLIDNVGSNLNLFVNPIFYFFVSAVVVQKLSQWIIRIAK